MSCISLSFAEFQYKIFWKKSVLSLKNESDDCQNVKVQKGRFSVIASRKPHWFASNLHMSCILLSFAEFQYKIFWKKSVLSLKNVSADCQNVKVQKGRFSAIASRKPHRFASNLHMSCTSLSFAEFQYKIFWKKSVLSLENESDDCQNV